MTKIEPPQSAEPTKRLDGGGLRRGTRVLLLAALALLGIGIGAVGQRLTQNDAWFLAVPIVLAIGWFMIADPEECGRNCGSGSHPGGRGGGA